MKNCPICNGNYKNTIGLKSHIYWKHYKKYTLIITLISFFVGTIVTIIIPVNVDNINFAWDKYVLDKEPDLYISIHAIKIVENDQIINNLSEEQKIDFLNEFLMLGVIPPWHNQQRPMQFNLKDEPTNKEWCLFWAFDSANRFVKEDDLPIDIEDKNKNFRDIRFTMPSKVILEDLGKNCPKCLGYEIYGISLGNRDIDLINFEICFPEVNLIIEVSDDIIQTNSHCIRIKKENIIEKESFLGRVIVMNNKRPLYYDLWFNPIRAVNGKYNSKGKDFEITNESITRIISGLVPNCHMP